MGCFGKSFKTRKEANVEVKRLKETGDCFKCPSDLAVRKMSKKAFPRRKKLFHVGGYIDFLNFD